MGTPPDTQRFESTYDWAGLLVRQLVVRDFDPMGTRVLDVGAGWGKYRILLPEYQMDACEIWEPYIQEERLSDRYGQVYHGDICDLVNDGHLGGYDLVIMGDVLEHIPRDRAIRLVEQLRVVAGELMVIVPYRYPQGEEHGNPYEYHEQDDLTPELMAHDYPELRLVALETRHYEPFKGLYRTRKEAQ
jgi:hypothetical protein